MKKSKGDARNIPINFKVSPVVDAAIDEGHKELGISESEYLRLCVYIGGPLLRVFPALKNSDRQQLKELMEDIGNMLVIQPAKIQLAQDV